MAETGPREYELRGEVSFPDLVRILKHSSDCFASSYSIRRYKYLPITLLTTSIPTIVHTDNSLTDISYCTSYWTFFTLAANTSTCKLYSATSRLLPTPLHPSTPTSHPPAHDSRRNYRSSLPISSRWIHLPSAWGHVRMILRRLSTLS